eukprot:m51a1_g2271 hypothetical protein (470) ;mRNA; f:356572-357981
MSWFDGYVLAHLCEPPTLVTPFPSSATHSAPPPLPPTSLAAARDALLRNRLAADPLRSPGACYAVDAASLAVCRLSAASPSSPALLATLPRAPGAGGDCVASVAVARGVAPVAASAAPRPLVVALAASGDELHVVDDAGGVTAVPVSPRLPPGSCLRAAGACAGAVVAVAASVDEGAPQCARHVVTVVCAREGAEGAAAWPLRGDAPLLHAQVAEDCGGVVLVAGAAGFAPPGEAPARAAAAPAEEFQQPAAEYEHEAEAEADRRREMQCAALLAAEEDDEAADELEGAVEGEASWAAARMGAQDSAYFAYWHALDDFAGPVRTAEVELCRGEPLFVAPGSREGALFVGVKRGTDCHIVEVAARASLETRKAATFPALAYVASGKRERRYVVACEGDEGSPWPYAAVVEAGRFAFVYQRPKDRQPKSGHQPIDCGADNRTDGACWVSPSVLAVSSEQGPIVVAHIAAPE